MVDILQQLYDTPFATAIRESEIVFPALESVHVLALALMAGTIAIVDLRLLDLVLVNVPASEIERRVVPATWLGFAVMAATGLLLFAAEAVKLEHNPAFLVKLALLGLAGLNMVVFQTFLRPGLAELANPVPTPAAARFGAAASLSLWVAVIAAGRAIAYFH
jgi:hypothetical protein